MRLIHWSTMAKFRNRIKKSAKQSRIILANDYSNSTPRLEEKTIRNIKTLGNYLCGIKLNFHLLLPLGKKEIKRITKTAHDFGIQTIADIKLNDIGNTNIVTSENLSELGFDALIANPIRVGVNAGSLDKDIAKEFGESTPEALVESAIKEIQYLEEVDFYNIKISVKHSNVPLMIESYRLLADKVEYPLHLGVTEAGPLPGGLIKSVAGISTLLSEGIGDTIRLSLTTDPIEEAKYGRHLLEYLNLRERKSLDLIACPSCGRAEVDVIKVAKEAQEALEEKGFPIQVAVMGCVVNGPGEAKSADLGIAAGKNRGHLFIKGQVVKVVDESDMVTSLVNEGELITKEGIEARLAAADKDAAKIAQKDAEALINIQGDINDFKSKVKSVVEITSNQDIDS